MARSSKSVGSDVIRFGIHDERKNLFAKNNKHILGKIVQNYPLIMEVQEKTWSDSLMINLTGNWKAVCFECTKFVSCNR